MEDKTFKIAISLMAVISIGMVVGLLSMVIMDSQPHRNFSGGGSGISSSLEAVPLLAD